MGRPLVVVADEVLEFILEIIHRFEVFSSQGFSLKKAEDNIDLVEPGTVFGQVHEADAMIAFREEPAARDL